MTTQKRQALPFLLLIGIISLLADVTREGARCIYGPYLGLLGVSAFMVSFTAVTSELHLNSIVDRMRRACLIYLDNIKGFILRPR